MKPAIFILIILCTITLGCEKEGSNNSFKVKLTDAPFNAQEVNVDIREVIVKFSKDTGWVSLNTTSGIYNLLSLQNNVQTVLATGNNPGGSVKELRLILGSGNSIKIDNQTYHLLVPSGAETGLKIKLNKELSRSIDSVIVDFDAGLSVIKTGQNQYQLKPVLKIK